MLTYPQLHISDQMEWSHAGKYRERLSRELGVCSNAGLQKPVKQTSAKRGRDVFDPALSTERNRITSSGPLPGEFV